ncbi:GAF domain-containing protein [Plantactinospora solaniradicis]|uniref:GAF domain-containing protein n=1 Tax=Plantactinospora solaniradicis TaxID=1723736 RepID=A0ABW1K6C5_9ACTN
MFPSSEPGYSAGVRPDDRPGLSDGTAFLTDPLVAIARITASLAERVSYASVTASHSGSLTTVATSSDVALAVDLAQYTDAAGPCLDALSSGKAVSVPDIAATVTWPGYRDMARRLGVRASLSIPLFADGGAAIAALNLYGRSPDPMASFTSGVRIAYGVGPTGAGQPTQSTDAGSEQLLTGLVAALQIRDLIQQALGVVRGRDHQPARTAYLVLRERISGTGVRPPFSVRPPSS